MVDKRKQVTWRQCPYCARWFIANKRQIYDTPKCRNNFNAKLNRLRNESNYHYVSIKGVMYERKNDSAPTIDAEPVVRCKDCKHFADDYVDTGFGPIPAFSCDVCELYGVGLSLNHYCSCGERKDDE